MDVTQVANVAAISTLVMTLVHFTKKGLAPILVALYAVLLGIVLALIAGEALDKLQSAPAIAQFALMGFLAGVTAIGEYELTLDKIVK